MRSFTYQLLCSLLVMAISARGSQTLTGIISLFLLLLTISEANLVAMWDNQGTCKTHQSDPFFFFFSCPSACPWQCLLSEDKRGECYFISMAQISLLLPNLPQHDILSFPSRHREHTMSKLCIYNQNGNRSYFTPLET